MRTFWIVVNANIGPSQWPHRHSSEESALMEAKSLARERSGLFYVFEAKSCAEKTDITVTKLSREDEVPF